MLASKSPSGALLRKHMADGSRLPDLEQLIFAGASPTLVHVIRASLHLERTCREVARALGVATPASRGEAARHILGTLLRRASCPEAHTCEYNLEQCLKHCSALSGDEAAWSLADWQWDPLALTAAPAEGRVLKRARTGAGAAQGCSACPVLAASAAAGSTEQCGGAPAFQAGRG